MLSLLKNKTITYLFTGIIATVLFIVVLTLVPETGKYTAEQVSEEYVSGEIHAFSDVESDGESEKIRLLLNNLGVPGIIMEKNHRIVYQQNLTGSFAGNHFHYCGDYDQDGVKEIYLITYEQDSVFLNILNGLTGSIIENRIFITTFLFHANRPDFYLYDVAMQDFNGDGFNDLLLYFSCGFTYKTRKCFLFDIKQHQLTSSPASGVGFIQEAAYYDINGDGLPEIFPALGAFGNSPESYPLSDQFIWFYILKPNLRFHFTPRKVGQYPGFVKARPLLERDKKQIAIFKSHHGNKNDTTFLAVCDTTGKIIRQRKIPFDKFNVASFFTTLPEDKPEKIILLLQDGKLMEFNSRLEVLYEKQLHPMTNFLFRFDANGDGNKEYFFSNNNSIFVVSDGFKHTTLLLKNNEHIYGRPSLLLKKGENPLLTLQSSNMLYMFRYRENPVYQYSGLIYTGIWLALFFTVLLIGRVFQKIAIQKVESEKQMAALQVSAMEKQLTPHFNLNILNAIGALYESQEKSKAQYYLGKYAKLLRNLLMLSGQIEVTIKEELEFTRNYLDLERLRMENKFDYQVVNEEPFLSIEIPKMLIHTFCENAVKHGLKHLKEKGQLKIEFVQEKNSVKIIISDNGIGREKAAQYSLMSTGKGLEIVNQNLRLYKQLKNVEISYDITDIYNIENEPKGTKVVITIPN